mgnify:FL=1
MVVWSGLRGKYSGFRVREIENNIYLCSMIDKLYYSIAEVSECLGVSQPTLRFWEKEFGSLKPQRTSKGLRQYSKNDVAFLKKLVYLTRDCGYTLDGAKRVLRQQRQTKTDAAAELAFTLNELKKFLIDMKQSLSSVEKSIIENDNTQNQ